MCCSLEWMVDVQIQQVEDLMMEIESLSAQRRAQCDGIARRLLKVSSQSSSSFRQDLLYLVKTKQTLLNDRDSLLKMTERMRQILCNLQRLRVTIRSAEEISVYRQILEQTRDTFVSMPRIVSEAEAVTDEMNEASECLHPDNNMNTAGDNDNDDDDVIGSEVRRLLVERLPVLRAPKIYSSISEIGGDALT